MWFSHWSLIEISIHWTTSHQAAHCLCPSVCLKECDNHRPERLCRETGCNFCIICPLFVCRESRQHWELLQSTLYGGSWVHQAMLYLFQKMWRCWEFFQHHAGKPSLWLQFLLRFEAEVPSIQMQTDEISYDVVPLVSYPPAREKCAGPSCNNAYKYRDSKTRLPLCSLQCYKAVQIHSTILFT